MYAGRLAAAAALLAALARMGQVQPQPVPSNEDGYRANNRGVALLEQFRFDAALPELRKAVAALPRYAQARINLAIAELHAGDLAAARKSAETAAGLDPRSPQPPYLLGLIAREEGRADDAVRELERVRALDADDVAVNVNLGQLHLEARRFTEAIPRFEGAARAEPYNVTAAYGLGTALVRAGRRDEGAAVLARFEKLRESPYKTQLGRNYLEQGRYAEALASTGAEAELVESRTPVLFFRVSAVVPAGMHRFEGRTPRLSAVDFDGDGDLDPVLAMGASLVLLRNDGGRLTDASEAAGLAGRRATAVVAGDLDNDGKTDLLLVGPTALLKGDGARFADAPAAGLPTDFPATAAALADLDHDGDLDVVLAGPGVRLLRNNGNGSFADVTGAAGLAAEGAVSALVPTDFDNRRDMDLLVARSDAAPLLFQNRRDGTFADVTAAVRLAARPARAGAAGDINKDGFTDLFLGGLQLSDGRGGFREAPLPVDLSGANNVVFADVDLDGLLDIVAGRERDLVVLRNLGSGWADLSATVDPRDVGPVGDLLVFDVNGDGAQDLLAARTDGSVRVFKNDRAHRNRSLRVRLTGLASNKSGLGAKLELRAGSLRQKLESSAASPAAAPADLVFGLGVREDADAVRVLWPSGILQTETQPGTDLAVTELDRKPSSCPYLYAWNGSRFEFVTDFLGGGEMGYWLGPGVRNEPDPVEYVRIAPGQLRTREGRFELRVTNELEEVLYLDQVELLSVSHPADVEVHPAEGMTHAPRPFRLFAGRDPRAPRARDDAGRDWSEAVSRVDRRFATGFRPLPIRGYAEPHALTLDLSGIPPSHTLLLLTAWTDYAFSSDNVAAHQRGLALEGPVLEAQDASGGWRTVLEDVGIPVGRPQTIAWDLAGLPRGAARALRLRTNMRIHWDRIALLEPVPLALETARLPRVEASLSERGFSTGGPFDYDYARATAVSPWKLMPGTYTRTGDVSELLDGADDLFVVARPGDALSLAWDARALAPLPAGWTRTFLLKGDGFSKEMDLHSASPDVAAPLPFHGMSEYPPKQPRPVSEKQARYNTRAIQRTLPPLELH